MQSIRLLWDASLDPSALNDDFLLSPASWAANAEVTPVPREWPTRIMFFSASPPKDLILPATQSYAARASATNPSSDGEPVESPNPR